MSESGSSFLSGFAIEEDEDATDGLVKHVKEKCKKGLTLYEGFSFSLVGRASTLLFE